jgi:hypothetical protein
MRGARRRLTTTPPTAPRRNAPFPKHLSVVPLARRFLTSGKLDSAGSRPVDSRQHSGFLGVVTPLGATYGAHCRGHQASRLLAPGDVAASVLVRLDSARSHVEVTGSRSRSQLGDGSHPVQKKRASSLARGVRKQESGECVDEVTSPEQLVQFRRDVRPNVGSGTSQFIDDLGTSVDDRNQSSRSWLLMTSSLPRPWKASSFIARK